MRYIALAAFALLPLPSQSQEVDCSDPMTQMAMNTCAAQDWQRADAALNSAYKDAMSFAKSIGIADELRAAQRAWLPYRDAACTAEAAQFEGGSIQPLIAYTCLTTLTEERTKHLLNFEEM